MKYFQIELFYLHMSEKLNIRLIKMLRHVCIKMPFHYLHEININMCYLITIHIINNI